MSFIMARTLLTKLSGTSLISVLPKTGSDLIYPIAANTTLPSGAKYLLVYTKTRKREFNTPIATALTDVTPLTTLKSLGISAGTLKKPTSKRPTRKPMIILARLWQFPPIWTSQDLTLCTTSFMLFSDDTPDSASGQEGRH